MRRIYPFGILDRPALRPRAPWLLAGLHHLAPGVRVQAWLGDLTSPGHLNLSDPATRHRVVQSVSDVLGQGFDGVHFDMEPVPSGSPGYLALLSAAHALTRVHQAILSVACDQTEPLPFLRFPARWLLGAPHWWSPGYLRAIADRVDEVAIMTYGTGVPTTGAYAGYVRVQTQLALAAVPPRVIVLTGLPAYHTREFGHTGGERVGAAIRGVRLALGGHAIRRPVGVALYVNFAATPADWAAYRRLWLIGPRR